MVLWGNTDGLEDNESLIPEEVAILLTGDYSKWNEISMVRQKVTVDLTSHSLLPAEPGIKPEEIIINAGIEASAINSLWAY